MCKANVLAGAIVIACTTSAQATPQLLASFDNLGGGASVPGVIHPMAFALRHETLGPLFDFRELGEDIFWENGQVGQVTFDFDSDADFGYFADRLTDGVDDFLHTFIGGAGMGDPESQWGIGWPDLIGNDLQLIRLIVNDFIIEPFVDDSSGQDGITYEGYWTYEFWGEPIPEPSTLALLILGGLAVLGRSAAIR